MVDLMVVEIASHICTFFNHKKKNTILQRWKKCQNILTDKETYLKHTSVFFFKKKKKKEKR